MSDLLDSALLSGLLARSALKDQQAFADLYRRTSPKLLGMALRILHRQDWAEEVLQESFVSIWQHAGDYTAAKSAPVTWMTSIVRNRALDFLRRPREELPGEFEAMLEVIADETPGLLDGLAEREEARSLVRCLETLEPSQRQTIALAFFHGLTHSELAAHLKAPLGTVKTWVRRGLERLKSCLGAIETGRQ
jgi:RNA polymerase sigma-70 factor, ECF subfamily